HSPHHFRIARLWQITDEQNGFGRERLAHLCNDHSFQLLAKSIARVHIRLEYREQDQLTALHFMWHANRRSLHNGSMLYKDRLNFSRTQSLACDLDRII